MLAGHSLSREVSGSACDDRRGETADARISGPADIKPYQGLAVNAGGCAAIDGLTKGLAVDLAPKGVRVNSISPGGVGCPCLCCRYKV